MTYPRNAAAPGVMTGREGSAVQAGEPMLSLPARRQFVTDRPPRARRPDLYLTYPDPRDNFRPTMFGLTLVLYRAEYRRCQASGWADWELLQRLPAPEVAA